MKALILSRTHYLGMVNTMPNWVVKKLIQIETKFIWNGRRPFMRWDEITNEIKDGGLDVPDPRARKDAMALKWLQGWMKDEDERKPWAYMVDGFLQNSAKIDTRYNDPALLTHFLIQNWEVKMNSQKNKLPTAVKEMVRVAKRYNVRLDALKLSKHVQDKIPIWYHHALPTKYRMSKKAAKCLQRNQ
ncbi:hypothetical protein IW261DRAFT_1352830 [Armillaria novae-zelandiae]|uniref:Uncharacterized protein n=1 Tax=Armillaria novae-zelandiae TaxID=153914 RepID=A0AA39KC08_9AGAR|nr:hypothetical protein IW261DRAFT_1352830 [Armillaria novae-zelandiae]